MSIIIEDLIDDEYTLHEGAGWFKVKGFAIRIQDTDDGVVVDIYKSGREDEDAIASCYAFDSELTTEDTENTEDRK
jgi:hypothetical protein